MAHNLSVALKYVAKGCFQTKIISCCRLIPQLSRNLSTSSTSNVATFLSHNDHNLVQELTSSFTSLQSVCVDEKLRQLGTSLSPGIVESVLKSLKYWKNAYKFFKWASAQDCFSHTCYTYNCMAFILSHAKRPNELKILVKEMVAANTSTSPGALGFLIRCLGAGGLVEEACYVFDHAQLLNCLPNNYTYNCLLEVLAKAGKVDLLELRLRGMINSGRKPDKYTLTPLLQVYCNTGQFKEALSVFKEINDNDWVDEYIFSMLVIAFSKWGEIEKALELIDRMEDFRVRMNEKTHCILIHGFVRERRVDKAIVIFDRMKKLGFAGDLALYAVLIDGLCEQNEVESAVNLYTDMRAAGVSPDASVVRKLISSLCQAHDLVKVNWLFEASGEHLDAASRVSVCNAVLEGLINNGSVDEAYLVIRAMMASKNLSSNQSAILVVDESHVSTSLGSLFQSKHAVVPDSTSFSIVIDGLCKTHKLDLALVLADDMNDMGCIGSPSIYNNLIFELCDNDRLQESQKLVQKMEDIGFRPTSFTYNSIFGCLCRREDLHSAFQLMEEMKDFGHEPWIKHYSMLVKRLCARREVKVASDFLDKMIELGFVPNLVAYSAVLHGLCRNGKLDQALKIFYGMLTKNYLPDVVAHNIIMHGFCRESRVTEAQNFLNKMLEKGLVPTVVTYNILVNGWCKAGEIDEALRCLSRMVDEGCTPSAVTYSTIIDGLCNSKRPDEAIMFWNKMKQDGCSPNGIVFTALINGLCKCERADQALLYFYEMQNKQHEPDSFLYVSLINAFISKENFFLSSELLKEMVQKANIPGPTDPNFSVLMRALLKLYKEENTYHNVKKLIEAGTFSTIHDVGDLIESTRNF